MKVDQLPDVWEESAIAYGMAADKPELARGYGGALMDCARELRAALATPSVSPSQAQKAVATEWCVGEFISSANRPAHVLMLAVGEKQIREYGAHRGFVRWVYTHPSAGAGVPQEVAMLTDAQIEEGRRDTFSTDNPFCPCDSKTMRKAVRWAERTLAAAWGIRLKGENS